ncbi:hypothetical protein AGMMS49991_02620 [Spirochaetia bacterium]|nr:hypothetical protein AGMMS49991_02620 [Spirochaetia bacterium]
MFNIPDAAKAIYETVQQYKTVRTFDGTSRDDIVRIGGFSKLDKITRDHVVARIEKICSDFHDKGVQEIEIELDLLSSQDLEEVYRNIR